MGARKGLIGILTVAFIIEVLWPVAGFFAPEFLIAQFKMTPTPEVLFLTFVLSWCLLFVAIICGLALKLVLKSASMGWTLSYILGLWWVGIGGSLFLLHGKIENLFLDGLKGAIICVFAYLSRGEAKA